MRHRIQRFSKWRVLLPLAICGYVLLTAAQIEMPAQAGRASQIDRSSIDYALGAQENRVYSIEKNVSEIGAAVKEMKEHEERRSLEMENRVSRIEETTSTLSRLLMGIAAAIAIMMIETAVRWRKNRLLERQAEDD